MVGAFAAPTSTLGWTSTCHFYQDPRPSPPALRARPAQRWTQHLARLLMAVLQKLPQSRSVVLGGALGSEFWEVEGLPCCPVGMGLGLQPEGSSQSQLLVGTTWPCARSPGLRGTQVRPDGSWSCPGTLKASHVILDGVRNQDCNFLCGGGSREGWDTDGGFGNGTSEVSEMLLVMARVVVTQACLLVKTHQAVPIRSGHLTLFKLYLIF